MTWRNSRRSPTSSLPTVLPTTSGTWPTRFTVVICLVKTSVASRMICRTRGAIHPHIPLLASPLKGEELGSLPFKANLCTHLCRPLILLPSPTCGRGAGGEGEAKNNVYSFKAFRIPFLVLPPPH